MFTPSLTDIKKLILPHHRYFPLAYPIDIDHDQWFDLYKRLSERKKYHALLESGRAGRYSFMAYQPTHTLLGKEAKLKIHSLDDEGQVTDTTKGAGNLLDQVKGWMKERQAPLVPNLPDFNGGLLGFFSYDIVREIEELPHLSQDDLQTPDLYLLAFNQVLAYDHQENQHWLLIYQDLQNEDILKSYDRGKKRLTAWALEIGQMLSANKGDQEALNASFFSTEREANITVQHDDIQPSFGEDEFIKAVQRIQKYISAGDVFQVNLSVRQSRLLESDPLDIYEELRKLNPSPYMGYLHFPDMQLVSASPEQLIKIKGDQITTRPIAGTRPRGQSREEDLQLARELIDNEKERAEHVMLVDLERNDLGKVSKFGSVEVDEFMVIEEYSHVMHIVSNVKGTLEQDHDAFDVIKATFPGGTITGAPKVRTMEIIEELEPVRRGLYTGSIGWVDFNGEMELNIIIRTILAHKGQAHVQAGAGIVIDSIPANEYKESLKKAEALWKAFELSKKKKIELSM